MRAIVGSSIVIENCTPGAKQHYKDILTFPNPKYEKTVNMGKWAGNIPREIILYQMRGNDMIIPFGMLHDVFMHRDAFDIVNETFHPGHRKYRIGCNIEPYDYQEKAISRALKCRNGVIVAPCGSGKTQIALAIVAALGLRTLWLTHTGDLMRQSMERAKKCLSLPLSAYGTITAGKVNAGEVLTFATVQTMAKIDLEEFKDFWDVVVVDECHKCVGTPTNIMMFYKVVNSLNARYKFGITATPKRADGLERCMFSLLGPQIHEITQDEVKDKTCPVKVFMLDTGFSPDIENILAADGTISYTKLITNIVCSGERNKKIAEDIKMFMSATGNRGILVLSERVEHLRIIMGYCKSIGISENEMRILSAATSKYTRAERESALNDLNSGKISMVFATYQLAKEGLDVPNLRLLVLASPQKDRTTVVQSVGRVSRKAEDKEFGIVWDYVDRFGMMIGYAKKRQGYYRKIGAKVID